MLLARISFLLFCLFSTTNLIAANCSTLGLHDGQRLALEKHSNFCDSNQIPKSDDKGQKFKVVCVGNMLKCVAVDCWYPGEFMSGGIPDSNGICPEKSMSQQRAYQLGSEISKMELSTYHANLLTTNNKSSDFFDACSDNDTSNEPGKIKDIQLMQNHKKIKAVCVPRFASVEASQKLALALIENFKFQGIGNVKKNNCTVNQHKRSTHGHNKYIRCKSDSGIYVEYEFKNINAGYLSASGLAKDLCPLFDMKQLNIDKTTCAKQPDTATNCSRLNNVLQPEYFSATFGDGSRCFIKNIMSKSENIPNIDINIFKDVKTTYTEQIKNILVHYINQSTNVPRFALDFYAARDEIWPVKINGKMAVFRFDPYSIPNVSAAIATLTSTEQMSCAINDGLFDGRHCWFLEEQNSKENARCVDLNNYVGTLFYNKKNGAGAKYDTDDQVCILKKSNTEYKKAKWLKFGSKVLGLVLVTVATAGTGTAAGIALTVATVAADGVSIGAEFAITKASFKFLKKSTKCKNATCAEQLFTEEFKHMLQLANEITPQEIDTVDKEMQRLIDLIPDDSEPVKKFAQLKQEAANSSAPEQIVRDIALAVGLVTSIANGGLKLLSKAGKTPGFVTKFDAKASKYLGKAQAKLKTTSKVANKATNVINDENFLETSATLPESKQTPQTKDVLNASKSSTKTIIRGALSH